MAGEQELMGSEQESGGGASNEVAPLESLGADQRQPAQVDLSRIDLSQLPQFRDYQSRADQRLALLEREAAQAREEARLAKMATMDDFEKVQFERDEYANRYMTLAQQLEEQKQLQAAADHRNQTLWRISQESGVPIDKLDASGPDEAWRSAILYLRQQPQGNATPEQPARQADIVDVGGGSPQTADARWRAQYNNLRKQKAPAEDIYKLMLSN